MSHTRAEEKDMMTHPNKWVNICLPVKNNKDRKPGDFPPCGVIFADAPTTVVMVNLWEISQEKIQAAERKFYPSVDDLLDAGWIVD